MLLRGEDTAAALKPREAAEQRAQRLVQEWLTTEDFMNSGRPQISETRNRPRFPPWVRRVSCLLAAASVGFALSGAAQVVNIPDPELQAAIRTALSKPTGDITVA